MPVTKDQTPLETAEELERFRQISRTLTTFRNMIGHMEIDLNERTLESYLCRKYPLSFQTLRRHLSLIQDTLCDYVAILENETKP